ncbi:MAG: SRPBCC family protein [Coriobacteriia bacterium]|nr:SRPBCC family protein [Coriobacteriia bacterium]
MQSRSSVLIVLSAEDIFAFLVDPANDRRWRSHLVSSRGSITAPGDHISQIYSYGGRSKTIELSVSEIDRPHRLTFALTDPVSARLSFALRPDGGGTRVSVSLSADLSGPLALFESRAQAELAKQLRADLDRLKVTLESR